MLTNLFGHAAAIVFDNDAGGVVAALDEDANTTFAVEAFQAIGDQIEDDLLNLLGVDRGDNRRAGDKLNPLFLELAQVLYHFDDVGGQLAEIGQVALAVAAAGEVEK